MSVFLTQNNGNLTKTVEELTQAVENTKKYIEVPLFTNTNSNECLQESLRQANEVGNVPPTNEAR